MSIVRLPRRDRYAIISSSCIEDKRLSWEARGMLIYLLSKKDNWEVKITDLKNQTKDCLGVRSGRDKVYKLIKELRCAGYLWRDYSRCGGVFTGVEYVVSEEPDLQAGAEYMRELADKAAAKGQVVPFPDLPEAVKPAPAAPFPANPEAIDKTEKASSTEKAPNTAEGAGAASGSVEDASEQEAKASAGSPDKSLPDTYPKNTGSKSYAAWMAYAQAYRSRYRLWPVCNKTMLSRMCQLVDRVGDLAARVAQYYVSSDTSPQALASTHAVGHLLQNCEGLATRAQAADRAAKASSNARENAARTAAEASKATPAALPKETKPGREASQVALSAMESLRKGRGLQHRPSGGAA
ncbi:hypothetical protein [Pseudomonas parafulva]|uniref:hypothetical protein n=1 Tax=Pseudomonas parafulva TaxID=157782 RepID=UPI000734E5E1|nr:hypothetical protein [Pseudomonas parafulva]